MHSIIEKILLAILTSAGALGIIALLFYSSSTLLGLMLLLLPGYSLLHIRWVRKKLDFTEIDSFVFGFVVWLFFIVATTIVVAIINSNYVQFTLFFNCFVGALLVVNWLVDLLRSSFRFSRTEIKSKFENLKIDKSFFFLFFAIIFIVIITLYTPILYQYDALAVYLVEGRQIANEPTFSILWPTFGDTPPVGPIIFSWFYQFSAAPLLRLIPLSFFFWLLLW